MRTTTEQSYTLLTKFRGPLTGGTLFGPFTECDRTGAPNENIVQNHLKIALLNVF